MLHFDKSSVHPSFRHDDGSAQEGQGVELGDYGDAGVTCKFIQNDEDLIIVEESRPLCRVIV